MPIAAPINIEIHDAMPCRRVRWGQEHDKADRNVHKDASHGGLKCGMSRLVILGIGSLTGEKRKPK